MTVNIEPMPAWMRRTRFRPCPPPVFPDGPPTRDEIELALALYDELDPDSQQWYGAGFVERLRERFPAPRVEEKCLHGRLHGGKLA